MNKVILDYLKTYSLRTISLVEIERLLPGRVEYGDFVCMVEKLMAEGVLVPIRSHGTNQANPALPNGYRIKKEKLKADFFEEIRSHQFDLHPLIYIDSYFKETEALWRGEQEWLGKLQDYLTAYGLPQTEASIWERSYEIMGDEKWISEGGGRSFLQRVRIFDKLKIIDLVEPLMFALNPHRIKGTTCYHLIVENKTTFDALAEVLPETDFLTLIYGAGKCFLNSITQLERQLNMPHVQHMLYYFGDLDLEGINIWYVLDKRRQARLALPFYQALLRKDFHQGKENQRKDNEAYEKFCACFSVADQQAIEDLFASQGYYPQEALSIQELQDIGRTTCWKNI